MYKEDFFKSFCWFWSFRFRISRSSWRNVSSLFVMNKTRLYEHMYATTTTTTLIIKKNVQESSEKASALDSAIVLFHTLFIFEKINAKNRRICLTNCPWHIINLTWEPLCLKLSISFNTHKIWRRLQSCKDILKTLDR